MRGYLLVFCAAVLWSLLGVFSKGILEAGVHPLEIAFWRAALAGGLFTAHALLSGMYGLKRRSDALPLLGFALFGVTVFYASLVLAIDAGGISLAFILLYSAPAFVALFAWGLLGEEMTPRKLALVALAIFGVVLVAQDGGTGIRVSATSLFWGLLAGLSYSSYYIFGKWILWRYEPVALYALVLPVGALGLLPFVPFSPKSLEVWGLLVTVAILSTYLPYWVYSLGLRRVEASRAVLVATVEPVMAALLAAVVFGERFGAFGLVGSALILAASILAALPRRTNAA